jgi:hypothetical protein
VVHVGHGRGSQTTGGSILEIGMNAPSSEFTDQVWRTPIEIKVRPNATSVRFSENFDIGADERT